MIKRVKWILDNVYCEDSDVRASLSSISMDDAQNGTINDFEAVLSFLFPTDPVPKKIKVKRLVA